jgi:hypothetical protein
MTETGGSMAAKLEWDGRVLDLHLWDGVGVSRVGLVRSLGDGCGHEYVTNVGKRRVSEAYQQEEDARQECFNEVRRLLKEAGVTLEE